MPQAYWIKFNCGHSGRYKPKATSTAKLVTRLAKASAGLCPECWLKEAEEFINAK